MKITIDFIAAFIATVAFAKLFHAPNKELVLCGITGGVAWLSFDVITCIGLGNVVATLIAAFSLTIVSRLFAVWRKMPVTVYLTSGVFPLVPGSGIYYSVYNLFTRENGLFAEYALVTLKVAIAITFGILFGTSIPQRFFQQLGKRMFHS